MCRRTYPGVGTGAPLAFILAIGHYITPALLWDPNDQAVSEYLAYFTNGDDQLSDGARSAACCLPRHSCCTRSRAASLALGLKKTDFRGKFLLIAVLLSPLIVLVVVGVGMYVFFAPLGESFVATTVAAMLQGFNWNLVRSSLSLGQNSVTTFFHLTLLVFTPGVMSGALFAVATSFGEMVVRLSLAGTEQTTLPREMFTGIRDNISPSVGALATILMVFSTCLLLALKLLRGELLNERWSESACTSLPVFGRQHRPSAS